MLTVEQLQQVDELAGAYKTLRGMGCSFGDPQDPNGLIFELARDGLFEAINLAANNQFGKPESKAVAAAVVSRVLDHKP